MKRTLSTGLVVILTTSLIPSAMAQRKEIFLAADQLAAPDLIADRPTAGRWWLKQDAQDWGAVRGSILLAGEPSQEAVKSGLWDVLPMFRFVPHRVPTLTIDPRATGWYRLYVGVYCDAIDRWSRPMVQGKLSGEPYAEFLQAPQAATGRTAELYWKAADLTGKKIHLGQPPAPMPHAGAGWMGGITHLRLVPMSEQEVAGARQEIELPPAPRRLFAMLDTTDEIFWNGCAETEDDIRAIVYRHHQAGFGRVYWRCFGTCLDNSLAVPEAAPRWTAADEEQFCKKQHTKAGWMPYIDLARRFDPLRVAVDYGRSLGCDVHAMVRFTNFNRPPYANFWHDHPEFRAQMLAGRRDPKTGRSVPTKPYRRVPYSRVMSFAYPEVRAFYVKFCRQIVSTGTRGILFDLLRHPPIAGFEPIVAEAFKKRYGRDMEELDIYRDPLVQEHLSGYLRQFLVDLRQAIGNDIEIAVRSSGPDNFALRGREWIDDGLINTIIDGHWYSGNAVRPTIDATLAAVGRRGQALAVAESSAVDPQKNWQRGEGFLSPGAILALAQAYSGRGVARFGLYESTVHTWCPDARRAIRKAGWSYDPGQAGSRTEIGKQTHVYKTAGTLSIKADVYRADDRATRPVVVWIHGGALINGHRESIPPRLKDPLLAAGCILVSIDYRLAPETKLPGIIEDIEDAFRWIRHQGPRLFRADASRIAVVGGSAGGYLTLTSGFRVTPRPAALVALWGYGDLVGSWYSAPSPHPRHHTAKLTREEAFRQVAGPPIADARERKGDGGAFYQFCRQQGLWPKAVSGWDPHTEAEKFVPYMPVRNVTPEYPPTLLLHGEADTDVPCTLSVTMAAELRRNKVEHRLITYPKAEHGLAGADAAKVEEAYRLAVEFVRKHLDRRPP